VVRITRYECICNTHTCICKHTHTHAHTHTHTHTHTQEMSLRETPKDSTLEKKNNLAQDAERRCVRCVGVVVCVCEQINLNSKTLRPIPKPWPRTKRSLNSGP